jgi:hypothetical protein
MIAENIVFRGASPDQEYLSGNDAVSAIHLSGSPKAISAMNRLFLGTTL